MARFMVITDRNAMQPKARKRRRTRCVRQGAKLKL
jgi:hypothetical protein